MIGRPPRTDIESQLPRFAGPRTAHSGRTRISPRSKQIFSGNSEASAEKTGDAAREDGGAGVFRNFYAHANQLWDGRVASGGGHDELAGRGLQPEKGRDAAGHGFQPECD